MIILADLEDRMVAATSVEGFTRAFARAAGPGRAGLRGVVGQGAIVLADRFETVASTPAELEPFLANAWPIYDFLDVSHIEPRIVETTELTDTMTRVLVRYSFVDRSGAHLTDGDFEYVLRRDGEVVRCHIGINISAEPNLAQLARHRGYTAPAA